MFHMIKVISHRCMLIIFMHFGGEYKRIIVMEAPSVLRVLELYSGVGGMHCALQGLFYYLSYS